MLYYVTNNQSLIWSVSEDQFNSEMNSVNSQVESIMSANNATGEDAFTFYYHSVLSTLWYEYVVQ